MSSTGIIITFEKFTHQGILQIDVRFSCVCPVIDHEFRHNILKVAVDPRGGSRVLAYGVCARSARGSQNFRVLT